MYIFIIVIVIVFVLFVFVILEVYDKVNWIIVNVLLLKLFIIKGIKK